MSKNIFVGNLPFSATSDELREAFSAYGTVTRAQVATDRETGRSRGFGFVEMSEGGDEAIAALNGTELGGRTLTVNEARPREDRPRSGGGGGGGGGGGRGGYGGGGYGNRY
jgi:RNA recognition motif-containing protein